MENVVDRKETTSLIAGGGGVGKKHLTALLMKQPPPIIRVSSPWLLMILQVHKDLTGTLLLTEEMNTALIMKFGSNTEEDLVQKFGFDLSLAREQNVLTSEPSSVEKINPAVRDVILHFHQAKQHMKKFEKHGRQIFGRIVNIGGQPQLLELLPRFISNITLGAIVVDLSQGLDKYPMSYFYGEDGKPVGRGIRSNLTNEQIMRVFLQMIASLCTEQKKVKFIIIGTHRDVEWKCWESRQTKHDKIKAIISSFNLEENVIYKSKSSLIFDVNAKNPEDRDRETAENIMELMMSEKYAVEVSIPVKHHKLELTAQVLLGSTKIAVSFDELYSNMSSNYDSPNAMIEGLEFLNKSFRLFYFKEIPTLVFGKPQRLLDLMTEITVYHIRLTMNRDQTKINERLKEFSEQAIVNEKILEQISNSYDHDFTANQMLKVMEKLLIIWKVREGKYLMPSLLTTAPLPKPQFFQLKWLQSDLTMAAYFPDGLSRFGVYCGTVCKLISEYKWEVFGEVSRNLFQFTQPAHPGIISLVDMFDSFFIVNLNKISSNSSFHTLSSICSKTCHTIFSAIKQVTTDLGYTARDPQIAFLCDHDSNSPHVAEYFEEYYYLRCIKKKEHIRPVTYMHRLWLERTELSNTHGGMSSSKSFDLTKEEQTFQISMDKLSLLEWSNSEKKRCQIRVIEEISPHWKKASDLLGLPLSHTLRIEMTNHTVENCCREVLAEWLSNEDGVYEYPRTWKGLCQLLDDMKFLTLAEKLREVTSSALKK